MLASFLLVLDSFVTPRASIESNPGDRTISELKGMNDEEV
jgi:hypothetical protein